MPDYGAGIKLDENFDIVVTTTGDVATASGNEELQKDLAVRITENLDTTALGGQFTSAVEDDIRIEIGRIVTEDERIGSISDLGVEQDSDDPNKINVTIDTTGAPGPFDLVIPL